jgi:hypothetical protein
MDILLEFPTRAAVIGKRSGTRCKCAFLRIRGLEYLSGKPVPSPAGNDHSSEDEAKVEEDEEDDGDRKPAAKTVAPAAPPDIDHEETTIPSSPRARNPKKRKSAPKEQRKQPPFASLPTKEAREETSAPSSPEIPLVRRLRGLGEIQQQVVGMYHDIGEAFPDVQYSIPPGLLHPEMETRTFPHKYWVVGNDKKGKEKSWRRKVLGMPSYRKVVSGEPVLETPEEVAKRVVRYPCPYCPNKNVWLNRDNYKGNAIPHFVYQVEGSPFTWHRDEFPFPAKGLLAMDSRQVNRKRSDMRNHVLDFHPERLEINWPVAIQSLRKPTNLDRSNLAEYNRNIQRQYRDTVHSKEINQEALTVYQKRKIVYDRQRKRCKKQGLPMPKLGIKTRDGVIILDNESEEDGDYVPNKDEEKEEEEEEEETDEEETDEEEEDNEFLFSDGGNVDE